MLIDKEYLRSVIYGGVDGIITIFNIISGVEGGNLKYKVIFILGFSALISDAFSMGVSDFLSVDANNKVLKEENEQPNPVNSGIITFISFILFGLIPLLTYLLVKSKRNYIITYISTVISLFLLGSFQSLYTEDKWYISGSSVSLYGIIASLVSYNIGKYLNKLN